MQDEMSKIQIAPGWYEWLDMSQKIQILSGATHARIMLAAGGVGECLHINEIKNLLLRSVIRPARLPTLVECEEYNRNYAWLRRNYVFA